MKYAIIGPRKRVNRVVETEPPNVPEQATVVEITDEQAAQVLAGFAADPRVFYFWVEGELQTTPPLPIRPLPMRTAEQHIARELGSEPFVALRISAFQDLEVKLLAAQKIAPKLQAMRAWTDGIVGLYATDLQPRNDWPEAPHTFEETVQEAAFILSQTN
jgi:hypothetical protein